MRNPVSQKKPGFWSSRHAATLSEVLVSIMILSIGLVSLATLFPISILRSLQATQLTNGAILSMQAEAAIDVTPELVHNPDGNGMISPVGYNHLTEHFQSANSRNYIVDPLGWNRALAANRDFFGSEIAAVDRLPRFHGVVRDLRESNGLLKLDNETLAIPAVTLPDSWVDQDIESTGTLIDSMGNASTTDFTFGVGDVTAADLQNVSTGNEDVNKNGMLDTMPTTEDRNGNGIWDKAESRIILFDISGKKSQVRTIIAINGRTVTWTNPISTSNFTPGLVRIETQEPRYTWLLSVRHLSSGRRAQVDVVIFFRRPDPNSTVEKHYAATFTGPTTTAVGSRNATITFLATDEPPLKKGGYILDATNAHWYRIQNITNRTTTSATIRLDRPARANGNAAMVLEGVIDVFPLKPKENFPLLELLN